MGKLLHGNIGVSKVFLTTVNLGRKMIFTEDYKSVIEDFGKDGKLSLFGVLRIFENIGNRHSDMAGDSVFKYDGSSKAWVLTDWQIEAEEYPSYGDSIKVETWSEELKMPLTATRDFALYKNNQLCVKGISKWVLFDLESQRLCKIESGLLEKYKPENKTIFEDSKLPKIQIPENFEAEKKIMIRRSDFDFNNHVHNLTYLDYALESLPDEVYQKNAFKKLRITYKTAITDNQEIIGKYACMGDKKIICIHDLNGDTKAVVQFE